MSGFYRRDKSTREKPGVEKMPLLFVGHGSPMNAVIDNGFTRRLVRLGKELPRPDAILVI